MKYLYILVLFMQTGLVYCFESRAFIERTIGNDGIPYTECATKVKLESDYSSVSFKKGVVFSPAQKNSLSIGNHQYYTSGIDIEFKNVLIPSLNIGGEVFSEINPIAENDMGMTSQRSIQLLRASYKDHSASLSKWTNGNFYINYSATMRTFFGIKTTSSVSIVGERGKGTYAFNYVELEASKWFKKEISKGIEFAIKNSASVRVASEVTPYYSISLGLISK